ncbi:12140_t:CDS:2, partial [Acaulospora colombiana]
PLDPRLWSFASMIDTKARGNRAVSAATTSNPTAWICRRNGTIEPTRTITPDCACAYLACGGATATSGIRRDRRVAHRSSIVDVGVRDVFLRGSCSVLPVLGLVLEVWVWIGGPVATIETPEPWVKRLTDDGQAYYYYNPVTEEASWARPEPTLDGYQSGGQGQGSHGYGPNANATSGAGNRAGQQQQQQPIQQGSVPHQGGGDLYNHQNSSQTHFQPRPGATRLGTRDRAGSEASYSGRERDNRRASVYSDDSEVSPYGKDLRPGITHHNTDPGLTQLSSSTNTTSTANVRPWPTPGGKPGEATAALQATGIANPLQVALALQSEMAPPSLPPLTIYSDKAGEAISAVVEAFSGNADGTKANGVNGMNGDPAQPQSAVSPTTTLVDSLNDRTSTETARVQTMADRVALVVVAVRNLLYVSGTLTGSLPNLGSTALTNHSGGGGLNSVGAGLNEDVDWVRQEIKPYQRKVTATLSKLVLSARAVNSNPDWPGGRAGAGGRVESDAAELQRAVTTFVYQIQRTAASSRAKRLQGVMIPGEGSAGIGPGLIGAGVAGGWKGAGFVPVGDSTLGGTGGPEIRLGREVVSELAGLKLAAEEKMNSLRMAIEKYKAASTANLPRGEYDTRAADLVILNGRLVIGHITDFLLHAEDVHIATAVDVMGTDGDDDAYLAGVKRARELIRTFETAKQALYDDGAVLLMTSQAIHVSSFGTLSVTSSSSMKPGGPVDVLLQTAIPAIQSNLGTVMEALELLLNIAHEQDEVNAGREPIGQAATGYDDDVEYPHHPEHYARLLQKQRERQPQYGQDPWYPGGPGYTGDANDVLKSMGIPHPGVDGEVYDAEGEGDGGEDMVSMTIALGGASRPTGRQHVFRGERDPSIATTGGTTDAPSSVGNSSTAVGINGSGVADTGEDDKQLSDDSEFEPKKKKAPASEEKLKKLLGTAPPTNYKDQQKMNQLPAYLRLDHHSPAEIVLNPDGGVRAGTLPALIERLTMHSGSDARFNETFMMTFKSFATIDQVFDMLVERYNITPPEGLTPEQLQEWMTAKKNLIRLRVINTMRKLIDVLEKEDLNILDRVKAFASEVVASDGDKAIGAKTLLQIVQRV